MARKAGDLHLPSTDASHTVNLLDVDVDRRHPDVKAGLDRFRTLTAYPLLTGRGWMRCFVGQFSTIVHLNNLIVGVQNGTVVVTWDNIRFVDMLRAQEVRRRCQRKRTLESGCPSDGRRFMESSWRAWKRSSPRRRELKQWVSRTAIRRNPANDSVELCFWRLKLCHCELEFSLETQT